MIIAIDCGHNCIGDTGATGNGVFEDNVTWRVGQKLAVALARQNIDARVVNPVRETSTVSLSLARRVANANNAPAVLYISIHCNAFSNPSAKGTEVYSFPGNQAGLSLATKLSKAIADIYNTTNRGAKTANFQVLRDTNMTAVLIELGFLTNKADCAAISDVRNDDKVVAAIVNAVVGTVFRSETDVPKVSLGKVVSSTFVAREALAIEPTLESPMLTYEYPVYDDVEGETTDDDE